MSGAILERVRLSAYLTLTALMGGIVWVIAAAWGWSFGGWLTLHFGYHDFAASGVVTPFLGGDILDPVSLAQHKECVAAHIRGMCGLPPDE